MKKQKQKTKKIVMQIKPVKRTCTNQNNMEGINK